jgi:hypothetical protein
VAVRSDWLSGAGEIDALYSLALLIALVVGGLGAIIFVVFMLSRRDWLGTNNRFSVILPICGILALFFGFVSGLVHFIFGHGSESTDPMLPLQFIAHHKAYWIVLALCVLLFAGWIISPGRGSNEDGSAA